MSRREGSWEGVRSGWGRKLISPRSRFVSKGRKKKTKKKQWDEDHKNISVARDVHGSWKKIKCMYVYSSDTAFAQHLLSLELRRGAMFPSARTSLTYPSRFCQAGTRITAGDP